MSKMCTMDGCNAKAGFCIHERMMMAMMAVGAIGAIGHWGLNLF